MPSTGIGAGLEERKPIFLIRLFRYFYDIDTFKNLLNMMTFFSNHDRNYSELYFNINCKHQFEICGVQIDFILFDVIPFKVNYLVVSCRRQTRLIWSTSTSRRWRSTPTWSLAL